MDQCVRTTDERKKIDCLMLFAFSLTNYNFIMVISSNSALNIGQYKIKVKKRENEKAQ